MGEMENVLASKEKGGLGVSSLYALNRALMFKGVWQFLTQSSSLWARVIKAIHGDDGKISKCPKAAFPSIWLDIVHDLSSRKQKRLIYWRLENSMFWDDTWLGEVSFKVLYKRLYDLETRQSISVAEKLGHPYLIHSFHRLPRGGVEQELLDLLSSNVADIVLPNMADPVLEFRRLR